MESDRVYALTCRLFEYVESPSLQHIRDPHKVQRLAQTDGSALISALSLDEFSQYRKQTHQARHAVHAPVEERLFLLAPGGAVRGRFFG